MYCIDVLVFCDSIRTVVDIVVVVQVILRAAVSGSLGSRREIVECLAVISNEFPDSISNVLPSLTPEAAQKLLSVVEATIEASTDPQVVSACAEMLRGFALVRSV